jgi:hypothetical protein
LDGGKVKGVVVIVHDGGSRREGFPKGTTVKRGVDPAIVFQIGEGRGEASGGVKFVICGSAKLGHVGIPE